jgi:hypothetical protein
MKMGAQGVLAMHNLLPSICGIIVLAIVSGTAAAAPLPPVETGAGIRSAALTGEGVLQIRLYSRLRGHGDRVGHHSVSVSARTISGEEAVRHELRLHRGQTYQHLRVAERSSDDGLIWTVTLIDD